MVRPKGVEPLTARFVAEYSIQLSYGRIIMSRIIQTLNGLSITPFIIKTSNLNGGDGGIRTLDRATNPILPQQGSAFSLSATSPKSGAYNTNNLKHCKPYKPLYFNKSTIKNTLKNTITNNYLILKPNSNYRFLTNQAQRQIYNG